MKNKIPWFQSRRESKPVPALPFQVRTMRAACVVTTQHATQALAELEAAWQRRSGWNATVQRTANT